MKVAVILSGCGNQDGSELQETLSLLLSIDRKGWQYQCFAPEGLFEVVPYTKQHDDEELEEGAIVDIEQRDIFEESGRAVRGQVLPISEYHATDFDALAFPGGLGAARNLSTFAYEGANMVVIDSVSDVILETYRAHKPICAMCIAPMILAKVLGRYEVRLTLGKECDPSRIAQHLGAIHQVCDATEVCVDVDHKIITTPAYMVGTHISQIFDGAANMVDELEKLL